MPMISAATRTLASLITKSNDGLPIDESCLSFDHPQVAPSVTPSVNLYCYYLQPSDGLANNQKTTLKQDEQAYQWFDLAFLVRATDHTALGEQHLLSEILTILSRYRFVPEQYVAPAVKGKGQIPIQVSNISVVDPFMLWQVLQVPLHLSLYVTLTVPSLSNLEVTQLSQAHQTAP